MPQGRRRVRIKEQVDNIERNVRSPRLRPSSPIRDISDDDESISSSMESLDLLLVEKKVVHYRVIFKEILHHCTMKKNGLDMYYERLTHWNNAVQTSVIFFSAVSTFIQSFSEEGSGISNYVPTITLSISSYSGFILAIAKYFKFDETKENVHNLRDRFSELHSRIKYHRDLIKPWEDYTHYKNFNERGKIKEWNTLINRVDTEYQNIIETKKELFSSYEKIIDTTVARKYDIEFLNREVKYIENKGKSQKILTDLESAYPVKTGDPRCGIVSERRGGGRYGYDDNDNHHNDNQSNETETDETETKGWFSCCKKHKANKESEELSPCEAADLKAHVIAANDAVREAEESQRYAELRHKHVEKELEELSERIRRSEARGGVMRGWLDGIDRADSSDSTKTFDMPPSRRGEMEITLRAVIIIQSHWRRYASRRAGDDEEGSEY